MANEIKVPCGGFKLGGGLSLEGNTVTDGVSTLRVLVEQVLQPSGLEQIFSLMPDSDIQTREDLQKAKYVKVVIYAKENEKLEVMAEFEPTVPNYGSTLTSQQINLITIDDSTVRAAAMIFYANFASEQPQFDIERAAVKWSTQS